MRIVTVSGVRGSGKTTLIRELIVRFRENGRRSAVILNESGEETYAQEFLEAHGVELFPLWGGWVGCSLATSLVSAVKKIRRALNPDFLFIEPSELVVTEEMRAATRMALRDVNYTSGPFITLVDGPNFQALWQERQPLLLGQLAGADIVAVSKSDLISAVRMEAIMDTLKEYCRDILRLSVHAGSGLGELVKAMEGSS